jgi:hypothetical protein
MDYKDSGEVPIHFSTASLQFNVPEYDQLEQDLVYINGHDEFSDVIRVVVTIHHCERERE